MSGFAGVPWARLLCFLRGLLVRNLVPSLASPNWLCSNPLNLTFLIYKMRLWKTNLWYSSQVQKLQSFILHWFRKWEKVLKIFSKFHYLFLTFEFYNLNPSTVRRSNQWSLRCMLGKLCLSWRNTLPRGSYWVWVLVVHLCYTAGSWNIWMFGE